MSNQVEETEEIKILARHQLASIVWPLRTSKESSHIAEFANHIKAKFNEPSATKYGRELVEFSNLRSLAVSCLNDTSIRDNGSLKTLKTYYLQLVSMLVRFKDCGAVFTWKDSFGRASLEGDLEFEVNNIMYNIAAIHNELGTKNPRNNDSSTQEAIGHFTSALWWLTELRDNRTGLKPKEMGHDLLTFFHHVLRAQAQECILSQKALKSGMRPENSARISAQVASDYDVAHRLAQTPLYTDPLKEILNGASIFSSWRATVDFKCKYYSALTQLLLGLANRDDQAKEIGTRIARLKIATQYIEPCKKLASDTLDSTSSRAAYETLDALIRRKLEKAIRYNDNVYHSSIPNRETLPQAECLLLITPAEFSISKMPEFKDLFSSLVTIESVQVSSIYSQKKDDLARDIKTKVSKQDEDLAKMMSNLNINKNILRQPASIEAPNDLIEICAELSMNPNIVDDVLTKLEELDDKAEETQNLFERIQDLLSKRPNKQFEEELKPYKAAHLEAYKTTQALHKQLNPELQQKIHQLCTCKNPTDLLPKLVETTPESEEVVRKLEKLLDKVDEMKQQRASLLSQLSQSIEQDDVIKHVVVATSEQELRNVFEKEIQKHNKYLTPLLANLKLQNEILDTLESESARYGELMLRQKAQRSTYNERVESYKKIYAQFMATSDGISQGLEYHNKMLDLVRKFHAKVQAALDMDDLLN